MQIWSKLEKITQTVWFIIFSLSFLILSEFSKICKFSQNFRFLFPHIVSKMNEKVPQNLIFQSFSKISLKFPQNFGIHTNFCQDILITNFLDVFCQVQICQTHDSPHWPAWPSITGPSLYGRMVSSSCLGLFFSFLSRPHWCMLCPICWQKAKVYLIEHKATEYPLISLAMVMVCYSFLESKKLYNFMGASKIPQNRFLNMKERFCNYL